MRVVAGTAKGRRLTAPRGERTRPTADRVKEALFSSLQPRLPGARVLDCYAGSGALGIEALSRGAAHATFVEQGRRALDALRQNLEVTDLGGRASVVAGDVGQVLRDAPPGAPFNVVCCDPPYAIDPDVLAGVLAALVDHLAPDAIVTIEADRRAPDPAWPQGMLADRTRRYGDTVLHVARATSTPGTDGEPPATT